MGNPCRCKTHVRKKVFVQEVVKSYHSSINAFPVVLVQRTTPKHWRKMHLRLSSKFIRRISFGKKHRDHTLNIEMCISRDDDRMSGGIHNACVVAFIWPGYIDNTQLPSCNIHFIAPSFRLKHQSRHTVYIIIIIIIIIDLYSAVRS